MSSMFLELNISNVLFSQNKGKSGGDSNSFACRDCKRFRHLWSAPVFFLGNLMNILVLVVLVICHRPHDKTALCRRCAEQAPTRPTNRTPNRFPAALKDSVQERRANHGSRGVSCLPVCRLGNSIPCYRGWSGVSSALALWWIMLLFVTSKSSHLWNVWSNLSFDLSQIPAQFYMFS